MLDEALITVFMYCIRYNYLMGVMIRHNRSVLFVGPTGTGKSVYVQDHLMNRLDKDVFIPLVINFSAQTSAGQTQVQCTYSVTTYVHTVQYTCTCSHVQYMYMYMYVCDLL